MKNRTAIALGLLIALLTPSALLAETGASTRPSEATHDTANNTVANNVAVAPDAHPAPGATPDAVMFTEYPAELSAEAGKQAKPSGNGLTAQSPGTDGVETSEAGYILDQSVGQLDADLFKPLNYLSGSLLSPVEKNIQMYSGSLRKHFARYLERSGKYLDMMKGIFRDNGLPEDLAFLALVESGFNPMAYSWAHASGPWQFIRGTGKKYGLSVNAWVDERRDPVKSTVAAARYLKDLYGMFGSWALALASYNAGEGNVSRAVLRNGTLDFWELRKSGSLASETKEYVPKFVAAKIIAQNPEAYGFEDIEYDDPMEFDEVKVAAHTSLEAVAKCCGVDVSDIKELNPELKRWCTPPNYPGYALRIPKGMKDTFLASYGGLPETDRTGEAEHVVEKGETLKSIASLYGVSTRAIAAWNGLGRRPKVKVGQTLTIPLSGAVTASLAEGDDNSSAEDTTQSEDSQGAKAPSCHTVKKGETLKGIARLYGVSTRTIAKLNGLGKNASIRPGQKLIVSGQAKAKKVSHRGRRVHVRRRAKAA